jgi:SAM-dependent methyltransferase
MIADKDKALDRFFGVVERDRDKYIGEPALLKWLFVDRLYARNERVEMNFYGFDGDAHLKKFFQWQKKLNNTDYLPRNLLAPLMEASLERDRKSLSRLRQDVAGHIVESIARTNAQDYLLQRLYPVPDRQQARVILDFGAGFGRMANLAFGAPNNVTQLMISVDAIPGPYLTQNVYYRSLGLKYADYIDSDGTFDFHQSAATHQLLHLPTWRLDLVPSASVDLVCCVQVLKELPGEVLIFALKQFSRMLKPGGAIYIRDHVQHHHPNQMPVDELLSAMGFALEFRPMIKDRHDIHGLPRIWRKLDPQLFFDTEPRKDVR